jgi:hypothetical protein
MAVVKPLPNPVLPKPAGKPARAAPAKASDASAFTPGMEAPRATPRLSDITATPKTAPAAGAEAGGKRLFTVQALSAYAGSIVDAGEERESSAASATEIRSRAPGEARPAPPGTRLDVKI